MLISYNDTAILGLLYPLDKKDVWVNRKGIQKMRLTIKKIKAVTLALAIILSVIVPVVNVQAATGKTTIAVSAGEIEVGEEVTITVKAKTDSGKTAKAKLELSYDEDILEFVSCSANYDGGAGGSVSATASSMTVKFKAVADGRCPLYVEAGNGVVVDSGSSLSSVEGCSTNIIVNAAPESNATEPESEEVKEEAVTETEEVPTEVEEDTVSKKELEEALERNEFLSNSYKQLEEKYQREKDFSRSVIYVLIFVIAILIVLLINVIAICFRKSDDDFEDSFKKKQPTKKVPKPVDRPVEKSAEKPAEKPVVKVPEAKKAEPKKEPVKRVEKAAPKTEKPAPKAEVRRNFEVFDFNDED